VCVEKAGVVLCAAEEKFYISLMMWLQTHHNVSYVNMFPCRDLIDILSGESDASTGEGIRDRLRELVSQNSASLIAVVDSRANTGDRKFEATENHRLNVVRERAQSWFPDLTVIGLSIDERFLVMSELPRDHHQAG